MGRVQVPVSIPYYGEFLDLPGLPLILEVKPDVLRGVVTVILDVPGMADCEAQCLINTVGGEVVHVQLVPYIPERLPAQVRLHIDAIVDRALGLGGAP
jgi:hypothetical protein